ncbi:MAG: choice-of-anchor A family protein [Desulfobacterium sp.]|nr:choice-of-anchor A family protein [Desulfobacterium sp.]
MKQRIWFLLALFVSLLAVACSAQAASISLGTAGAFNTFIFNDFACSSDTEGRLAVGGNATLSSYSVGDKLQPGQYDDILVVGGDLTYTGGRVYYGDIRVGGSANMPGYNVADGKLVENDANLPVDFAAEAAYLKSMSAALAKEVGNGTVEHQGGSFQLTGDGVSGLQVFNLDGNDLLNAHTYNVTDIAPGATVLFNVSGETSGLTNMSLNSLTPMNDRVLFNFYEATTLELSGIAVEGSILAPQADVISPSGVVWGTIIASSWDGPMQQNHVSFEGELPIPTPAPAAIVLLGGGLAGLAGVRRKFLKK